uniref:Interferon-related developmental regulator N-terminal domain-containing protein n=1 Tax=Aotus nancymaae TaxID=37293 RepID=A0A2K5DW74_AOTNA
MPKNKKRYTPHRGGSAGGGSSGAAAATAVTAGGQHRNVQQLKSDEDASIETMSHCSGYSDPSSFAEDGPEVLDEEGTQEDLEYKLKGLIDLTLADKEVRMTLTDSIEHCLKKGKSDERRANLCNLLWCLQFYCHR